MHQFQQVQHLLSKLNFKSVKIMSSVIIKYRHINITYNRDSTLYIDVFWGYMNNALLSIEQSHEPIVKNIILHKGDNDIIHMTFSFDIWVFFTRMPLIYNCNQMLIMFTYSLKTWLQNYHKITVTPCMFSITHNL